MSARPTRQLLGTSTAAEELRREISLAARSDAKVLITGETGVGKEVVAHLIHDQSRRCRGPFVTINCAGVPETLLESAFFGHARGSFTDAVRDHVGLLRQAHRGTVLLDEIGEMTPRLQGLLLRFLETGEVQTVGGRAEVIDVRVIAATNRDLAGRSAAGEFRLDLFYRLNVVQIEVPPLRERSQDIPAFVECFLDQMTQEHRCVMPTLLPQVSADLQVYDWPGNVRQLRNVIERVVVRATPNVPVDVCDLPSEVTGGLVMARMPTSAPVTQAAPLLVKDLWRQLTVDHESFWVCVYPVFKRRELTRDQLRGLVACGLSVTWGYYQGLVSLFNMPKTDYKRFMNFLTRAGCNVPPHLFRKGPAERPTGNSPMPLIEQSMEVARS
jgi:transcriptional regulator with PAS, ATPase and Fis domain